MSAIGALQQARALGIQIKIDGYELVLSAQAEPPTEIITLLSQNKAEIISLGRPYSDGWSALDWCRLFDECAAAEGFGGGLTKEDAEFRAFQACIRHWLYLNQVDSIQNQCAHCRRSHELIGPYLTRHSYDKPQHTWLHQECSVLWHKERRDMAANTLLGMELKIHTPKSYRAQT